MQLLSHSIYSEHQQTKALQIQRPSIWLEKLKIIDIKCFCIQILYRGFERQSGSFQQRTMAFGNTSLKSPSNFLLWKHQLCSPLASEYLRTLCTEFKAYIFSSERSFNPSHYCLRESWPWMRLSHCGFPVCLLETILQNGYNFRKKKNLLRLWVFLM